MATAMHLAMHEILLRTIYEETVTTTNACLERKTSTKFDSDLDNKSSAYQTAMSANGAKVFIQHHGACWNSTGKVRLLHLPWQVNMKGSKKATSASK